MLQDNLIQVEFRLAKRKMYALLADAMHSLSGKVLQVDGVKLTLAPGRGEHISVHGTGKTLTMLLPVQFSFVKPAGIFTVEGKGEILLQLVTQVHISEDMEVQPETTLVSFQWVEPPRAQVGVIEFSIESLADCLIRHLSGGWLHTLDDLLAAQVRLKERCHEAILEYAHNKSIHTQPDLFLNASLFQVQSDGFRDSSEELLIDLWLEVDLKVSDSPVSFPLSQQPRFYWANTLYSSFSQRVDVEYSYEGLADLLAGYINGLTVGGKTIELAGVSIGYDKKLWVKLDMMAPIRSMVTLTCQPGLDTRQQRIYAEDVEIDIAPTNFLYKLSAPLIENFLESHINHSFPLDPAPFLDKLLAAFPRCIVAGNAISLIPEIRKVRLDAMSFATDRLRCSVALEEASLLVEMDS